MLTRSDSIIAYCNSTRDYMVPSVWGPVPKGEDPYAPQQSGGCCIVM
jgi:guanine nucleotide-binding protein subunit gamma